MAYTTLPHDPAFTPREPLPQHLSHKPVFALPYQAFDGPYAGKTDVRYISVGIAQYDPEEVTVKTMRFVGSKWTRQAEELPLHRPVDMTLFLAKAVFDSQDGIVNIPAGTLDNQTSQIIISQEDTRDPGQMHCYNAAIKRVGPGLQNRLNELRDLLNDLKTQGKI